MNYLDRILKSIEYLPPFPLVVARGIALMKNPEVSAAEISGVIRHDQSIVSNLLRFCNSAYVGLKRPITNIHEAVVFVGMNHLKKILLITGARPYFEAHSPGYESRKGELWRHSLGVSLLSSKIATLIPEADPDDAFIASLLHDVGKLVISRFVIEENGLIMRTAEQEHIAYLDAERRVLGCDHAEVGSRILTLWRFPPEVAKAVGNHHARATPEDPPLEDIVKMADFMAVTMGFGSGTGGVGSREITEIFSRKGIGGETIESMSASSVDEIKNVEHEFGFTGE
jgi:putative nucleotidyltransferase with HDIG domain